MTSLEGLRSKARAKRREVTKTLTAVRGRLNVKDLTQDALSVLDPELQVLGHVKSRVKRYPLLAGALVAGAAWLAGGGTGTNSAPPERKRRKITKTANSHKGERP